MNITATITKMACKMVYTT